MKALQVTLEQGLTAMQSAQEQSFRKYEATDSLQRESLERHKTGWAEIHALQLETSRKFDASDSAYREQLAKYHVKNSGLAAGRASAMIVRVLVLFLLVYIAYRVS